MIPFDATIKMAELIHRNYLLLPVINRFEIQLGFGDRSIKEVCEEHGINTEFFLVIVNSFHDHDYFPQQQLLSFPLNLILDYISKSHNYYLDLKIPQIESMIQSLIRNTSHTEEKHLLLIDRFFQEYKAELIDHIKNEENNVYPYVVSIDTAYSNGEIDAPQIAKIETNSIKTFAEEHTNVEDKLYDLKNIIIKYLPPSRDNSISNTLLFELFRLERDLNDHARIEDKVLVPKVELIEKEILRNWK